MKRSATYSTRRRATVAALLALPWSRPWAREVESVTLADEVVIAPGTQPLTLIGAGVFRFLFRRYYVCGLYLPQRRTDLAAILQPDAARRIGMVMLREVSAWEFLWGLDRGVADNAERAELQALEVPLERLRGVIRKIGVLPERAAVSLDYLPGAGTRIAVNGVAAAEPIPGKALNDALLRVWIGERPLDDGLKQALLGAN